jgi:hypothetical protein
LRFLAKSQLFLEAVDIQILRDGLPSGWREWLDQDPCRADRLIEELGHHVLAEYMRLLAAQCGTFTQ